MSINDFQKMSIFLVRNLLNWSPLNMHIFTKALLIKIFQNKKEKKLFYSSIQKSND